MCEKQRKFELSMLTTAINVPATRVAFRTPSKTEVPKATL